MAKKVVKMMNLFKVASKGCLLLLHSQKELICHVKPILNILQSAFWSNNSISVGFHNRGMINGHFIFGFYPNFRYLREID